MSQLNQLEMRVQSLERHLAQENPILLCVVASFCKRDKVARRLGFLQGQGSYAARVSWWPLIAVLGTYASGKSTFLNHYHHIIDLSDLVLVFFDARHPEPGTIYDTLEHFVSQTIQRPDSSKFLYILNQIGGVAEKTYLRVKNSRAFFST